MIKCKEESAYHKGPMVLFFLALAALLTWLGFEIYQVTQGGFSLLGFSYVAFFAVVMAWRYGCKYSYTLTDNELIAERRCFGMKSLRNIPIQDIELYANKFVRKPFMHVKEKGYWYSSGDERPVRIVVYFVNGKRKGLLIKVSDDFINALREIKPNDYYEI